jgi:mRNA interferase RelE/StbE
MGARSDSEVYDEMGSRVAALSANPTTLPLAEVIERLGKVAAGLAGENAEPAKGGAASAAPGPGASEHLPDWLAQALVKVVGLTPEDVAQLSEAEANERWSEHISAPR